VVLLNNRAQALLKREWKGDQYAALRDSSTALDIDPDNEKAHFRQVAGTSSKQKRLPTRFIYN